MISSTVQPTRRMTALWPGWACDCREPNGAPTQHGGYVMRCSVCRVARHNGAHVAERGAP